MYGNGRHNDTRMRTWARSLGASRSWECSKSGARGGWRSLHREGAWCWDPPSPSPQAFVRSFSAAVGAEYSSKGILMQTVSPLVVETNMTWPLKSGLFVMKPEDFARQALDTLDLTSQTPGCLNHAVQNILLTIFLPNWFLLSRQGLKSLNLLVNWNRAMWLGATKKELDKRP